MSTVLSAVFLSAYLHRRAWIVLGEELQRADKAEAQSVYLERALVDARQMANDWRELVEERKAIAPAGDGTLAQVFAERAAVRLDSEPHQLAFVLPSEVRPPGTTAATALPTTRVH